MRVASVCGICAVRLCIGVVAPQNPRFPEFQVFTRITGTGGGRPCTVLQSDTQADFFMASLIRSATLDAASCRVAVDRCE